MVKGLDNCHAAICVNNRAIESDNAGVNLSVLSDVIFESLCFDLILIKKEALNHFDIFFFSDVEFPLEALFLGN